MEDGLSLWARVCASVNRMGGPRSPRVLTYAPDPEQHLLDLHGMTVQQAFRATRGFLSKTKLREVLIVTGRSGVIRDEFPYWLDTLDFVTGSTLENGGGAYRITVRQSKPQ